MKILQSTPTSHSCPVCGEVLYTYGDLFHCYHCKRLFTMACLVAFKAKKAARKKDAPWLVTLPFIEWTGVDDVYRTIGKPGLYVATKEVEIADSFDAYCPECGYTQQMRPMTTAEIDQLFATDLQKNTDTVSVNVQ